MITWLSHNRGAEDVDGVHDKFRAALETLGGAGLMSLPLWGHVLDDVTRGLQFVAALCGALIGLSGVHRLFFRKSRRSEDRARA